MIVSGYRKAGGAVAFKSKMVQSVTSAETTFQEDYEAQRITFTNYVTSVDVHCEYEGRFAAPDCTLFRPYGSARLEYSQENSKGTYISSSIDVPCAFALEGDELVMRIDSETTLTNSLVSGGGLKGPAILYVSLYADAYTIAE